ncbi:MAG: lycopene cyclase [Eudoraea sp.]|nr:lycopene cyclase [Eudoraea sp.]
MTEYDFIIIGAGAAGLMMADGMGKDPAFKDKSVLLLDKDAKKTNDRTWCYWEQGTGSFDSILHKTWDHVYVSGNQLTKSFPISPYSYKMIRGIDFYESFLHRIESYPNVLFVQETVVEIIDHGNSNVKVSTGQHTYEATQVFDSRFLYKKIQQAPKYPILQQHFIGWFIKTEEPVFDETQATFMDFSLEQKGNTRFMYVLPFSKTEALVEYTLFSFSPLPESEYEKAIMDYMRTHLNCTNYSVSEKEKGSIPMTCNDFSQMNSTNVFHIGTAGGWSKPSTGFTFRNTTKKSKLLLEYIKTNKPLSKFNKKNRFWYYDLLLLNILYRENHLGQSIFESLFKKRSPQLVFKFLDEETNLYEDIRIIMAPKPIPFFKSLLRHLYWTITMRKKQWH